MKKKTLTLTLVLMMLLLAPACKKKAAGQMNPQDMLAMVPGNPVVLMAFDFQRFAALSFFDKALKEDWQKNPRGAKEFKDYQEFVQQTGVDLQKDVYGVVVALFGSFEDKEPTPLAVVNLKYDEAKLLGVLRGKGIVSAEENYGGRALYTLKNDDKPEQDMRLAFLNKGMIVAGAPEPVKLAIDLAAKKGTSVLKSAALMKYVDAIDKKNMFWLAVGSLPDKMKQAPAGGMMPVDLSKAEAFTAVADFKNKTLAGELRLISHNEAGNKQIADMLNGLKALGAMGAQKEPELGELLNGLQLSSAADHVKLTFSISEALLNKLGDKAKEKAKTMGAAADASAAASGEATFGELPPQ
jgi:hypothetical protein